MKRLLALLVLVAAIGVAWVLTRSNRTDPASIGPASQTAENEDSVSLVDSLSGPNADGTNEREGLGEAATESQDSPIVNPVPASYAVRVVTRATKQPVENAEVYFLDRTSDPNWQDVWYGAGDAAKYVREHGQKLYADSLGELTIPGTKNGALLGVGPKLLGETEWIGIPGEPIMLTLSVVPDLEVRVIDESGAPLAHVPVALCLDQDAPLANLLIRKTAVGGRPARFTNLTTILKPDMDPGYAIALAIPLQNRARIALRPEALPDEPLELVLPPVGKVHVRVVDETGAALTGNPSVQLGTIEPTAARSVFRSMASERMTAGVARFPLVGVGSTFTVRVDNVPERRPVEEEHAGPASPGETVEITIAMSERWPILVGQLVDERGQSIAAARGRIWLSSGGKDDFGIVLEGDAAGRFRAIAKRFSFVEGRERSARFDIFAAPGRPPLEALVDLSFELPEGETDLGKVEVVEPPLLLTGTVTDKDGLPLVSSHVMVQIPGRGEDGAPTWTSRRGLSAATDGEGKFSIYGNIAESTMRVVVRKRAFRSLTLEAVATGTLDLLLELEAGEDDAGSRFGKGEDDK